MRGRPHRIKHRKHPPPRSTHETKNDHVKAALSPRVRLPNHPSALANEQGPLLPYLSTYLPSLDARTPNHACKLPHLEFVTDLRRTKVIHCKLESSKKADLMASDPSLRRQPIRGGRQREERKERVPPPSSSYLSIIIPKSGVPPSLAILPPYSSA